MIPWAQLRGQERAVQLLTRAIALDRVAQGYLFCGPQGVGKALAARLFAQALLQDDQSQPPDLLWLEPTYKKGDRLYTAEQAQGLEFTQLPQVRLEQIRNAGQFLSLRPLRALRKVVVIEGAETMQEAAANALLKTLEEPLGAVLVLLAPQVHRVLPTVRSRCQLVPFYRLSDALIRELVGPNYPPEVITMAQGSPGEVVRLAQELARVPPKLLDAFLPWPRQPLPMLQLAREVEGLDLKAQLWLVDYLQQKLWAQGEQKALLPLEQLRKRLTRHVQPRLAWEVALLETLSAPHYPVH
ncbi:hypothetical protein [Candidatus Cyanaurora vandensis]|uniref:hypothetical protein n=1 Tax=Candidatus Cyanaurora vandensis TaxID=2714958 RepID=UPI00257D8875|nr:hypothetical protein [Candidatus Cyanaurora vandensis]